VIGLFLERTIPGGMTFAETVAAIKGQHGIDCVPLLRPAAHDPEPRLPRQRGRHRRRGSSTRDSRSGFNELADGSPGATGCRPRAATLHVLPGIGTRSASMDGFTGPDDFVAALAESHRAPPRSRIYLVAQAADHHRRQARQRTTGRWILLHSARIIEAVPQLSGRREEFCAVTRTL
jgi:hypothetical protein